LRYDVHFWHTSLSHNSPQKLLFRFLIFAPEVMLCACAWLLNNENSLFLMLECSFFQHRYLTTNELHMQKFGSIGARFTSFLGHFV
jgi:hypothetical protein